MGSLKGRTRRGITSVTKSYILAYSRLVSLEYLPFMLTAFLVGVVFSGGYPTVLQIILGLISVSILVMSFNSFNAVYDKEIDAINKPNRPLPLGTLKDVNVLYISFVFFAISLVLALLINTVFFAIDLVGIFLAIAYSLPSIYLKKFLVAGTMVGNLMFAVIYPLEGWSLTPTSPIPWYIIIFLIIVGFGTAVLKDFEDVKGDKVNKIKTIPVVLGHSVAADLVGGIFIVALIILIVLILNGNLSLKYLLIVFLIFLALVNVYFLSKTTDKKMSRRSFVYGIIILTLINIGLILIKLI